MKKSIFFLALVLTVCCKSNHINKGLEKIGAFNKKAPIVKLSSETKNIVFIPMVHIAIEEFYIDVKKKIDSLSNLGYYFYCEEVITKDCDSITLRKYKKLQGFPFSKTGRYKQIMDSIYKLKYSEKIVDQPSYKKLGVDSIVGRNVDVSLKDMVSFYESKHGEIKLTDCDYKTSLFEKTICKDKLVDKKIKDEVIVDFRNTNIVNTILKEKRSKIAIIYGSDHFKGIREELLKQGFK